MDIGVVRVASSVDKVVPRVFVIRTVDIVHHAMPGIGVKNATFSAMLDVHPDRVNVLMELVPRVKLGIGINDVGFYAAKDVKVNVFSQPDIAQIVGTGIGGAHVTRNAIRCVRLDYVTNLMEVV